MQIEMTSAGGQAGSVSDDSYNLNVDEKNILLATLKTVLPKHTWVIQLVEAGSEEKPEQSGLTDLQIDYYFPLLEMYLEANSQLLQKVRTCHQRRNQYPAATNLNKNLHQVAKDGVQQLQIAIDSLCSGMLTPQEPHSCPQQDPASLVDTQQQAPYALPLLRSEYPVHSRPINGLIEEFNQEITEYYSINSVDQKNQKAITLQKISCKRQEVINKIALHGAHCRVSDVAHLLEVLAAQVGCTKNLFKVLAEQVGCTQNLSSGSVRQSAAPSMRSRAAAVTNLAPESSRAAAESHQTEAELREFTPDMPFSAIGSGTEQALLSPAEQSSWHNDFPINSAGMLETLTRLIQNNFAAKPVGHGDATRREPPRFIHAHDLEIALVRQMSQFSDQTNEYKNIVLEILKSYGAKYTLNSQHEVLLWSGVATPLSQIKMQDIEEKVQAKLKLAEVKDSDGKECKALAAFISQQLTQLDTIYSEALGIGANNDATVSLAQDNATFGARLEGPAQNIFAWLSAQRQGPAEAYMNASKGAAPEIMASWFDDPKHVLELQADDNQKMLYEAMTNIAMATLFPHPDRHQNKAYKVSQHGRRYCQLPSGQLSVSEVADPDGLYFSGDKVAPRQRVPGTQQHVGVPRPHPVPCASLNQPGDELAGQVALMLHQHHGDNEIGNLIYCASGGHEWRADPQGETIKCHDGSFLPRIGVIPQNFDKYLHRWKTEHSHLCASFPISMYYAANAYASPLIQPSIHHLLSSFLPKTDPPEPEGLDADIEEYHNALKKVIQADRDKKNPSAKQVSWSEASKKFTKLFKNTIYALQKNLFNKPIYVLQKNHNSGGNDDALKSYINNLMTNNSAYEIFSRESFEEIIRNLEILQDGSQQYDLQLSITYLRNIVSWFFPEPSPENATVISMRAAEQSKVMLESSAVKRFFNALSWKPARELSPGQVLPSALGLNSQQRLDIATKMAEGMQSGSALRDQHGEPMGLSENQKWLNQLGKQTIAGHAIRCQDSSSAASAACKVYPVGHAIKDYAKFKQPLQDIRVSHPRHHMFYASLAAATAVTLGSVSGVCENIRTMGVFLSNLLVQQADTSNAGQDGAYQFGMPAGRLDFRATPAVVAGAYQQTHEKLKAEILQVVLATQKQMQVISDDGTKIKLYANLKQAISRILSKYSKQVLNERYVIPCALIDEYVKELCKVEKIFSSDVIHSQLLIQPLTSDDDFINKILRDIVKNPNSMSQQMASAVYAIVTMPEHKFTHIEAKSCVSNLATEYMLDEVSVKILQQVADHFYVKANRSDEEKMRAARKAFAVGGDMVRIVTSRAQGIADQASLVTDLFNVEDTKINLKKFVLDKIKNMNNAGSGVVEYLIVYYRCLSVAERQTFEPYIVSYKNSLSQKNAIESKIEQANNLSADKRATSQYAALIAQAKEWLVNLNNDLVVYRKILSLDTHSSERFESAKNSVFEKESVPGLRGQHYQELQKTNNFKIMELENKLFDPEDICCFVDEIALRLKSCLGDDAEDKESVAEDSSKCELEHLIQIDDLPSNADYIELLDTYKNALTTLSATVNNKTQGVPGVETNAAAQSAGTNSATIVSGLEQFQDKHDKLLVQLEATLQSRPVKDHLGIQHAIHSLQSMHNICKKAALGALLDASSLQSLISKRSHASNLSSHNPLLESPVLMSWLHDLHTNHRPDFIGLLELQGQAINLCTTNSANTLGSINISERIYRKVMILQAVELKAVELKGGAAVKLDKSGLQRDLRQYYNSSKEINSLTGQAECKNKYILPECFADCETFKVAREQVIGKVEMLSASSGLDVSNSRVFSGLFNTSSSQRAGVSSPAPAPAPALAPAPVSMER